MGGERGREDERDRQTDVSCLVHTLKALRIRYNIVSYLFVRAPIKRSQFSLVFAFFGARSGWVSLYTAVSAPYVYF